MTFYKILIRNRSWILTIHKDRIFWKNLLENKEMVFKNGVKNIQAAGYNGGYICIWFWSQDSWNYITTNYSNAGILNLSEYIFEGPACILLAWARKWYQKVMRFAVCERFQNHNSQFRDRITYSIYAISVLVRVLLFTAKV